MLIVAKGRSQLLIEVVREGPCLVVSIDRSNLDYPKLHDRAPPSYVLSQSCFLHPRELQVCAIGFPPPPCDRTKRPGKQHEDQQCSQGESHGESESYRGSAGAHHRGTENTERRQRINSVFSLCPPCLCGENPPVNFKPTSILLDPFAPAEHNRRINDNSLARTSP